MKEPVLLKLESSIKQCPDLEKTFESDMFVDNDIKVPGYIYFIYPFDIASLCE